MDAALSLSPPQVCDGQPDCEVAPGEAGSSPEERACGAWGPWSPWEPCSRTCGPGLQSRSRRCSPPGLPVLQRCPGTEHQSQACFTEACPGDGWGPQGGTGAEGTGETTGPSPTSCPSLPVRSLLLQWMVSGAPGLPGLRALSHVVAPRHGNGSAALPRTGAGPVPCCLGTCTASVKLVSDRKKVQVGAEGPCGTQSPHTPTLTLVLLAEPCPHDGCPNATCSGELVFWPCAPCPLTCDDISGQAVCLPEQPCSSPGEGTLGPGSAWPQPHTDTHPGPSSGCWCPNGQVLGSEGQCVWPQQCPCLVNGMRYWPGQRIKSDCQLCICQDGRPQHCRPDPDCAGEPLPQWAFRGVHGAPAPVLALTLLPQ